MPLTVIAGIPVNVRAPALLVSDPADAEPHADAVLCRPYEPPVTSVPAAVALPTVDTNARFTGVVAAVYAVPFMLELRRAFSSTWTRLAMSVLPVPSQARTQIITLGAIRALK
jgi:hypothetical protein